MTDKEIRSGENSVVQKQADDALRESENKYRLLIENSHDIIYALDLQGVFTFASPSWKRILGQNNDAVVGHRFHEFVHPDDIPRCEKFLASLLETPEPLLSIEYRVRNVEGEWRWYSSNAAPVINADGTCTSFVGIGNDVTDRKQADQALASSLSLLKATMESTADGILVVDLNGRITLWNHKFADMWQIPEELLSKHLDELALNYVLQKMAQPETFLGKVRELYGQPEESSNDHLALADGRIFERYSQPQRIGDEVVGRVWSFSDITKRKRAEEETQRKQAFFDRLVESAPEGIAITDPQGRVMRVNTEFVRMFGYGADEAIGQDIDDLVAPPGREEEVRAITTSSVQGEKILLETVRHRKDGTLVDVSVIAAPIVIAGKQEAVYAIYRDITDRKKTEEETQRKQAFFDRLVESAPEGIAITDSQGRVMRVNTEFVRMFGYGADEAVGQDIDDLVAPPGRKEEARALTKSTIQGEKTLLETVRGRKDGTLVDVSLVTAPIVIAGKQEAVYAIYRDITKHKRAEEALWKEQMSMSALMENIPDHIYFKDTASRFLRVNSAMARSFGLHAVVDAVGKTDADFFSEEHANPALAAEQEIMRTGQPLTNIEEKETWSDGSVSWVVTTKLPLRDLDGRIIGICGISSDITERKQMEQKLEEMATHDFLTGLPNRVLLLDRFTIAAALAHRNKARIAVMSLDLDKFKSINDTLGHDAGDQVLKVISTRLVRILRASDTFARVGGDEFISVMMETDHIEEATAIANKILDSFTEPLSIAGHQLHLSTSIGIAIYPENGEDLETLTKKSDAAMYYSKSHGRNQFKFYSDGDVQIG
jgi:diguanylate cyclase (GGDEF)-like protein/PAS domain S-box-containing protein